MQHFMLYSIYTSKNLHVAGYYISSILGAFKGFKYNDYTVTAKTNWLFGPLSGYLGCRGAEETGVMLFANCIRQP